MAKSTAVIRPNLGMYLDRPPLEVPLRGLTACNNVRITNGKLTNQGIGWDKFTQVQLNGAVTLIDNFFLRSGAQLLIFGSLKDLYLYDEDNDTVAFITPRYETGTVDVTNGSAVVTGTTTGWTGNLKVGDEIFFGSIGETDPESKWYDVASVDSDTQLTLTANYAESTDTGIAYTARQNFTGTMEDYWRTEIFPKALPDNEDKWYATNGSDYVVEWNGQDDQVTSLSALQFRCKELFRFKNMLIYGNLTLDSGENRPFSFRNSDIGTPTDVTNGSANEFIVHDGIDSINGFYGLGDVMVIYGPRTISLCQFVGTPLLFVFRTVISGLGPIAGRMVADFGDFHEFIGPDAQYRFDGVGLSELGFQVWRETLRKQDPGRLNLALSHFDEERGVLVWLMPFTTDPPDGSAQTALLEHYVEDVGESEPSPYTQQFLPATATGFFERLDTLRFSDIGETWAEQTFRWNDRFFQAAFPFNLIGDENGFIYTLGTADAFDGQDIESFARFSRRPVADERHRGVIRRVYPFAEAAPGASYNLGVLVWGTDQLAGTLELLGQFLHDLTHTSKRFVSVRQAARFVEIEFATTGQNRVWTLQGYDIDATVAGERDGPA